MPTFSGPTDRLPFSGLLYNWFYDRGITVYRADGVWVQGTDIEWDTLATADVVPVADRPGGEDWNDRQGSRYAFLGGRVYTISSAVAATLTASGFGAYVSRIADIETEGGVELTTEGDVLLQTEVVA